MSRFLKCKCNKCNKTQTRCEQAKNIKNEKYEKIHIKNKIKKHTLFERFKLFLDGLVKQKISIHIHKLLLGH